MADRFAHVHPLKERDPAVRSPGCLRRPMTAPAAWGRRVPRRGTVLVATMIVTFALVAMVLVLGQSVRVDAGASANDAAAAEASMVARGAEQYVLAMLSEDVDPAELADPSHFERVPVGTGYFWVVRPDYGNGELPAFGLVDESSKVDLNRARRDQLLLLPGMTDELASAIVDWRDADDTPETAGAENETYLGRAEGYRAKNEPFETVEEMLLLNTMTHTLLYGSPRRPADAGEMPAFASERYQEIGLFDFFTAWGGEWALDPDGEAKVNVNGEQNRDALRERLTEKLGASRANQVIGSIGQGAVNGIIDFAARTGLTEAELTEVEPYLIAQPVPPQQGAPPPPPPARVNVSTAPREVLLTIDGLTSTDVDTLIARRPGAGDAAPQSVAWVLEALGEPQTLRETLTALSGQVTGRGAFYSADVVAVSGNGRAFRRVRIVVDASTATPKVVYRRDLTDQGWPRQLDGNIRTALRSGAGI